MGLIGELMITYIHNAIDGIFNPVSLSIGENLFLFGKDNLFEELVDKIGEKMTIITNFEDDMTNTSVHEIQEVFLNEDKIWTLKISDEIGDEIGVEIG